MLRLFISTRQKYRCLSRLFSTQKEPLEFKTQRLLKKKTRFAKEETNPEEGVNKPGFISVYERISKGASSMASLFRSKEKKEQDRARGGGADYRRKREEQKKQREVQDSRLIKEILDIIEKNVNSTYFDERYLDPLVGKLFGLQNPIKAREENLRLNQFFALDCPSFFAKIAEPNYITSFSKLGNSFKLQGLDFNGFWELIAQQYKSVLEDLTIEQILTILINVGYAARVEAPQMFKWAKEQLNHRVQLNYNPQEANLYIKEEDLPRIMNTFIHYRQFDNEMMMIINQQIEDSLSSISYEILAEVLIIYAESSIRRNMELFGIIKDKLIRGIPYLESKIVNKLLWAFQKGEYMNQRIAFQFLEGITNNESYENYETQQLLDFLTLLWKSGFILAQNLLKSQIQEHLTKRLKEMNISQLLHTMWLYSDINADIERKNKTTKQTDQKAINHEVKLSRMLVQDLEMYIYNRLSEMGDHQLAIFLQCLVEAEGGGSSDVGDESQMTQIFSQRIMNKVLRQISDILGQIKTPFKAQIMFALTREGMKSQKFRIAKDGKKVVNLIRKIEEQLIKEVQALNAQILSTAIWCHSLQPFLNPDIILQEMTFIQKQPHFSDSQITRILQAVSRIEQCVKLTPLPQTQIILEQCRKVYNYMEPFIEAQIKHFSPQQFVSLFITFMRKRKDPIASQHFEEFLEKFLKKHISEFSQVHLQVMMSSLMGRSKEELKQYLKEAKERLSEREIMAEMAPKLRDKIREEVEMKIKEKIEQMNLKTDYEVPQDERLEKYSKQELAYSIKQKKSQKTEKSTEDAKEIEEDVVFRKYRE